MSDECGNEKGTKKRKLSAIVVTGSTQGTSSHVTENRMPFGGRAEGKERGHGKKKKAETTRGRVQE